MREIDLNKNRKFVPMFICAITLKWNEFFFSHSPVYFELEYETNQLMGK